MGRGTHTMVFMDDSLVGYHHPLEKSFYETVNVYIYGDARF